MGNVSNDIPRCLGAIIVGIVHGTRQYQSGSIRADFAHASILCITSPHVLLIIILYDIL